MRRFVALAVSPPCALVSFAAHAAAPAYREAWLVPSIVLGLAVSFCVLLVGAAVVLLVWRRPSPPSPSCALWLDVTQADGTKARVELSLGTLRIGRLRDNDLVLSEAEVSGHHAQLELSSGCLVLSDLGSTNGTKVDGVPTITRELRIGNMIQIGRSWLRVGGV